MSKKYDEEEEWPLFGTILAVCVIGGVIFWQWLPIIGNLFCDNECQRMERIRRDQKERYMERYECEYFGECDYLKGYTDYSK